MKSWIAFVVALVLICALNFYLGAHFGENFLPDRVLSRNLETMQESDAKETRAAIHAIEMLDAGQNHDAVRLLARPIAHYYTHYRADPDSGQSAGHPSAIKLLQLQIAQLAQSNSIVAQGLTNRASLYAPVPAVH